MNLPEELSTSELKMLNTTQMKVDTRSRFDIEDNRLGNSSVDERNSKLNKSVQNNRQETRTLQFAGKIKSNKIAPIYKTEGTEPDTFDVSRISKVNDSSVDMSMNDSLGDMKLAKQLGNSEYNKQITFKNAFHE